MINYAITGHKGLIGEYLKNGLDANKYKCVLSIDKKEGFDVLDLLFKEKEIKDKIDIFFHFAAQCKINESISRPELPHKNNVDGIFSVLEFCKKQKIPKIVVASTSRVLSEQRNPYVASKIYVEELTKAYHDCYDIDYLIIRPSTVYGPMFDETSRLINNFITSAFKGDDLRIYGNKNKTLDFTYVEDFVDGVLLTIKGPWNREYNISGNQEMKIIDVAQEIIKQVKSKSKIVFLPPEKAQPQNVCIDTSQLQKLGWKPKMDIKKGIGKMIEWYKLNPWAIDEYNDNGLKYYVM
ncbi:MAG: NAD-dependent epimerase/dehydratase family protein [Candidatus Zambryskibacteria bacterium]|nr:NAD-dependent epimerase/dehydratase family protein [Candidatus Zambryskibacteria bacterium]